MEVHAHSHTPRKKWTHYFWEFLMLFLAVFCGFLAENQREHYIEHNREKQFVRSYYEDLKTDIGHLDSLLKGRKGRKKMIDSLTVMLDTPDPDVYGKKIYFNARPLTVALVFFNNDRTIQQLKNGGNLRLIRKQEVSNAIMGYDQQVRWIQFVVAREEQILHEYIKLIEEVFDAREFNKMATGIFGFKMPEGNPRLLKKDKQTIQRVINKLHFLQSVNSYLLMVYGELFEKAKSTKQIIESGYSIN
jgi:hypothetical protein